MKVPKLARVNGHCHGGVAETTAGLKQVVLVGSPNVGKSVVFGNLTGKYVTVSNYPGTTVEVTRGRGRLGGEVLEILDTPGLYSLLPITEEERVSRSLLLQDRAAVIVQVADAKNLERMLHLTLQLAEAELPVILDLNLMDEAERLGVAIDVGILERELGLPVVATVATAGRGMKDLEARILYCRRNPPGGFRYDGVIEGAIARLQALLKGDYPLSRRAMALLLLQGDPEIGALAKERLPEEFPRIEDIVEETKKQYGQPLHYVITLTRQQVIRDIVERATSSLRRPALDARERLSRLMMHPVTGIPILLLVIYGLYQFVGVFGAQVAVEFLEDDVFGAYVNPLATRAVVALIPWPPLQDLFVNEYGIITLGIRYAVAIILPLVTTFFIAFSIIEDTGYLPRLAMLVDRIFKRIGLSGRAVIPIILGFSCATMATLVTRTLETRRERIIATFLLALAIPCSAQIGVMLALLAGNTGALWLFVGVMTLVFVLVGYLASEITPGERAFFYMEVPPLRWPTFGNVLVKTYSRVEWYFKEILPLFILASVFIWIGRITGLFDLVVAGLAYPVGWIGLPREAATVFLFGFFRRDYGAAGLYDLKNAGILGGIPLVVSVITLALFMPCIALFSMIIKERGLKMALGMAAFIFPFAFLVGFVVNFALVQLGVAL